MTTTMDAGEQEEEEEELGEGVGAGVAEEKISEGAQQPEIHQQPKHHDKKIIGGGAGVSGGLPTNKNHFLGTTTIPTATSSFKTIPTVAAAVAAANGPCGLSSSVWLLRSLCPQRSLLV